MRIVWNVSVAAAILTLDATVVGIATSAGFAAVAQIALSSLLTGGQGPSGDDSNSQSRDFQRDNRELEEIIILQDTLLWDDSSDDEHRRASTREYMHTKRKPPPRQHAKLRSQTLPPEHTRPEEFKNRQRGSEYEGGFSVPFPNIHLGESKFPNTNLLVPKFPIHNHTFPNTFEVELFSQYIWAQKFLLLKWKPMPKYMHGMTAVKLRRSWLRRTNTKKASDVISKRGTRSPSDPTSPFASDPPTTHCI
ncbi:hypothetical protein C8R45DRAFT_1079196 [Mycena sanguinolenta]|nr:hypothetical protein C8R45DRAFT_1079196 [Mycena sanguinolenta]